MLWSLLGFLAMVVQASGDDEDDGDSELVKPKSKKKSSAKSKSESSIDAVLAAEAEPLYTDEESGYVWFLALLVIVFCFLVYRRHKLAGRRKPSEFQRFQLRFLVPYALCVSVDWLQGPYVFKLYSFYGLAKSEIGTLFIAGFLSSLLFGTVVAGMADRWGRRNLCLAYCVLHLMACITKHSKEFPHLLFGRVLGGMATSILHSGFEAYYVSAHHTEFPRAEPELLLDTLGWMNVAKGLTAISSSILAGWLANRFGFTAPFDLSAVAVVCGALGMAVGGWKENYGDRHANSFSRSALVLSTNPKVWLLGFIQATFEGGMYVFVYLWSPLLEHSGGDGVPHGVVFACFMAALALGSTQATWIASLEDERLTLMACTAALASLGGILLFYDSFHGMVFLCCVGLEAAAGAYYPAIASQRAKHVPNEVRATVLGMFRIPLNLIVVLVLLNAHELGTRRLVMTSAALLGLSLAGQRTLTGMNSPLSSGKVSDADDDDGEGSKT
ncbi:hypothetical protein BASA81_008039 [Batrachochytrium salamandrivorans]|nr:hypothetical protein BASA81_008039 [Batrachochytrium salamandrivorans]